MPTNKPRVTITMAQEQLAAIEEYQRENNKKNQTQAILDLIARGLEIEAAETEFSLEEYQHIQKCRALDVHGRKVVDGALQLEYDRITKVEDIEQKGWVSYISLFDLAVSAGTGEPLGTSYYSTKIQVPTEQVPQGTHCCLRVNGDSMEPAYKDGDIVFVHKQEESVRPGEIGVFTLNGEGYMKRLGDHTLESLNPKYPPILVANYDDLRCVGKVLGKL